MNQRRRPARGDRPVTDRPLTGSGMSDGSESHDFSGLVSRSRVGLGPVRHSVCALAFVIALLSTGGCSLFRGKASQDPAGGLVAQKASDTEEVFLRVREAKAQNSVVVQVVGDSVPVRVLPLPPGERSVFVSDLLKQTGLQDKLGAIKVTVFRASTHSPMGIPMDVKFASPGGDVRPESDYALRAGDRLRIAKDDRSVIGEMLGALIPGRG